MPRSIIEHSSNRIMLLDLLHVAQTLTDANTTETALYELTIPGGLMGPNDALRMRFKTQFPASAVSKHFNVKLASTSLYSFTISTSTIKSLTSTCTIGNAGAVNSQVGNADQQHVGFGQSTNDLLTAAVDMSEDQILSLTGAWLTAGDGSAVMSLKSIIVELLRG